MIFRYPLMIILLFFGHTTLVANELGPVIYRGDVPGAYSLPALMLATMQKPNVVELPLVITKDNVPVVYDDIFLQNHTNVAEVFPGRNRQDSNYYLIDFTLAEVMQLNYRQSPEVMSGTLHLTTFNDAFQAITATSKYTQQSPTILPVIKYPWFHTNEGTDISSIIVETLIAKTGSTDSPLHLKCYDPEELQRIKKNMLPGLPVEIRLVQGIDGTGGRETMRNKRGTWISYNYEWMFTRLGLRVLAGYAENLTIRGTNIAAAETLNRLITDSHSLNMGVYVEVNSNRLNNSEILFENLLFTLGVDGIALSQPAILNKFLAGKQQQTEAVQQQDTGILSDEDHTPLLSDPETLSRRLKTIQ